MKIKFIEIYQSPDDSYFDWTRETIYDTEKLKVHEHEYSYVQRIVEEAERGIKYTTSSRKYSFSDCTDWYEFAECPVGSEYDHCIEVELG